MEEKEIKYVGLEAAEAIAAETKELFGKAVRHDVQDLTDEQKTQVRENIDAASAAELTAKAAELTAEIESKVEKVDGCQVFRYFFGKFLLRLTADS